MKTTPQGLSIAIATTPTVGFYPIEYVENGQVTIPNFIQINGTGNTGKADLVVNDSLLRTSQDSMIFAVDNTGGGEFELNLYIPKTQIADFTVAVATADQYFAGVFSRKIAAGTKVTFSLQLIDGLYILDTSPILSAPTKTLNFDTLTNCTYDNGVLNYTEGNLDLTGSEGYQAISSNPVNFEFELDRNIYIMIGDGIDYQAYADKGLLLNIADAHYRLDGQEYQLSFNNKFQLKDIIQVTIADSKATIINVRTGDSFTTDPSDYLANPKYLNVTVVGTNPLPIKAI